MKNILNNWHWIRILRLVIGGYVLYGGINQSDNLMLFFGGFFVVQAIFNWGCSGCSSGNCKVDTDKLSENEKLDT
jgi:hypothetical protein